MPLIVAVLNFLILANIELFLKRLNKRPKQKVFEYFNFDLWRKLSEIFQIVFGCNTIELIIAPIIFEIVFDLRCKFLFENTSLIKLL